MTLNELRSALQEILEAEQGADVDWRKIEHACGKTLAQLKRESTPDYMDDFVLVFLEDAKLRQDDKDYAKVQHERLSNWLQGSEIISR